MVSKIELRAQIKLLRAQMDNLEVKCQEREDKLLKILLALEPFVEVLTSAQQKKNDEFNQVVTNYPSTDG